VRDVRVDHDAAVDVLLEHAAQQLGSVLDDQLRHGVRHLHDGLRVHVDGRGVPDMLRGRVLRRSEGVCGGRDVRVVRDERDASGGV
jgi:hypothetical protein